jgi:hypothetical protein
MAARHIGAGLAAGIDFRTVEGKGAEGEAGGADGADFGVGGGIVVARDSVEAFTDDGAVFDDDGTEGTAAAGADVFRGESNRPAHEVRIG